MVHEYIVHSTEFTEYELIVHVRLIGSICLLASQRLSFVVLNDSHLAFTMSFHIRTSKYRHVFCDQPKPDVRMMVNLN
jgi:hypothetical protein